MHLALGHPPNKDKQRVESPTGERESSILCQAQTYPVMETTTFSSKALQHATSTELERPKAVIPNQQVSTTLEGCISDILNKNIYITIHNSSREVCGELRSHRKCFHKEEIMSSTNTVICRDH